MDVIAVAALFPDLTTVELTQWVEQGWVVPDTEEAGLVFHEIDVARVRLIHDLRRDMAIGEDTIPLVLSLLDQVYELRNRMNIILRALCSQPEDVRAAVLDALRRCRAAPHAVMPPGVPHRVALEPRQDGVGRARFRR